MQGIGVAGEVEIGCLPSAGKLASGCLPSAGKLAIGLCLGRPKCFQWKKFLANRD